MAYMVPNFLMGQGVQADFSPIQNALAKYQEARKFDATNLLQREQMDWQRQNALMQRDLEGLRLDQDWRKHQDTMSRQGPLTEAQAALARAHARYYDQASKFKFSDAPLAQPRQPILAKREDGTLYEINSGEGTVDVPRVESRVLGQMDNADPSTRREHMDYGEYGKMPAQVPGIVVTPKGATDVAGTRAAQGQRAANAMQEQDRLRFLEGQRNQQLWTSYYNRPPRAGHMYDKQGREVPVGPLSNSAESQERKDRAIGNMQRQIDEAEKTLLGSWNITRSVAKGLDELGTPGRFVQPQFMEKINSAFGQYKEGVLQTVYALSGKQTTNKEMEAFLGLYMPLPGESDFRIKEKTQRLKKMLSTLQSNVKRGMVYDEAERAALSEAAAADFGKLQGRAPGAGETPRNPSADRLRNKYGLE